MTAMAHVLFDTYKFFESLRKSGMPEQQANALTDAQREVFSEVMEKTLATKSDIQTIEATTKSVIESTEATIRKMDKRLSIIEAEIKLLKWMIGIITAGVGALILKAFF